MTDIAGNPALASAPVKPPGELSVLSISVFTGSVGILTGFALFLQLARHPVGLATLLAILGVFALLSFGFEYIRNRIDAHEETLSVSRVMVTLIVLAAFELFVGAAHTMMDMDHDAWSQVGTAIIGNDLATKAPVNAVANLLAMAGLWVVIGILLSVVLGMGIWVSDESRSYSLPLAALVTGGVVVPVLAVGYVLLIRLIGELYWAVTQPDQWAAHLDGVSAVISDYVPFTPLRLALSLMKQVVAASHGWGALTGLGVLIIALLTALRAKEGYARFWALCFAVAGLAAYGVPFIGYNVGQSLGALVRLFFLMAVIWAFPALLLGWMAPYFDRHTASAASWSWISWIAAAVLVVFWIALHSVWYLLSAGLLVAAGIAVANGAPLKHCWPALPISIATFVVGITQLTLLGNFLWVHELSRAIVQEPLRSVSPRYQAPLLTLKQARALETSGLLALPARPELRNGTGLPLPEWSSSAPLFRLPKTATPTPAVSEVSTARGLVTLALRDSATVLVEEAQLTASLGPHVTRIRTFLAAASHDDHQAQASPETDHAAGKDETSLIEEEDAAEVHDIDVLSREPDLTARSTSLETQAESLLKRMRTIAERARDYGDLASPRGDDFQRESLVAEVKVLTERITVVRNRASALDGLKGELKEMQKALADRSQSAREDLTRTFELCVTGALGFWVAMGMLAVWSIRAERDQS